MLFRSSGIGLGVAQALAAQGCDVVINGFGDRAEIEKTRSRLEDGFGIRAVYSAADMSRPEDVRSLVAEAEEAFGRVDVLVNNAGIQHTAPVEDFPAEKWDAVIAINLSAAFHAVQAALPGLRRRGWGRIINTASTTGLVARHEKAASVERKSVVEGR